MIFKKKTKVQIVVISVVSLLLVTAGVALASTTNATLTFCASKSSGILRYTTNGKCKSNETKLQLNKQGPTGARGPVGPAGPAGPAATSTPSPTFQYAVGDVGPAGGVIFFVDTANQFDWFNYIETAPLSKTNEEALNLSTGSWCWGKNSELLSGATELRGIGDGKAASELMLLNCQAGAAHATDTFSTNSESDWYVPTRGEAYLAFSVLTQYGYQFHLNDSYYTSTQQSSTEAWKVNGVEMTLFTWNKWDSSYVLPIRYFE